jgi:predicted glycogen debranching enzyme
MTEAVEWLEADGLGGFAMGTADGIRTRRYHALLLAATAPPDRRMVLVADLEVFVETASGRFALSSHRYLADVVHPDGARYLTRFVHQPWPRWEWTLPDGTRIVRELVVEAGPPEGAEGGLRAPRVALRWSLPEPGDAAVLPSAVAAARGGDAQLTQPIEIGGLGGDDAEPTAIGALGGGDAPGPTGARGDAAAASHPIAMRARHGGDGALTHPIAMRARHGGDGALTQPIAMPVLAAGGGDPAPGLGAEPGGALGDAAGGARPRGVTSLHVLPLLAGRDYHATHHENPAFRFDPELDGDCVTWRPYAGVPAIHCAANGLYQHAPDWYRAFHLADEAERGLDAVEDLATPGVFTFDLASGPAAMLLSTAPIPGDAALVADQLFAREAARRAAFTSPLTRAADAYLVARTPEAASGAGRTILAGYPWFADWGRDTCISLRGLCLATGRRADARAILARWAGAVSRGMLPNRFDERDASPEYNSVDAALWFVIAAAAYLEGDAAPADRDLLTAAIAAIVDGTIAGTRHAIRVDDDGLVACGAPGVQLTWMDARVGDHVITPRIGKPVEIQALWINALAIAGRAAAADQARAAFARFWDPRRRQLHDVIDADHVRGAVDPSCRPNQIFAVGGLPQQVLDGERARAVVDAVERQLWTPAGLRSLSAADPRYRGRYRGGPAERDAAYHNGTVWPWLAGPFIEAWVRVRGSTPAARAEARSRFLAPLLACTGAADLGHLPEICDGDPPHRPAGCPFQAWSLAEVLRIDQLLG